MGKSPLGRPCIEVCPARRNNLELYGIEFSPQCEGAALFTGAISTRIELYPDGTVTVEEDPKENILLGNIVCTNAGVNESLDRKIG